MPHMTLADSLALPKPIHFDVFLQVAIALGMPAKRSGLKNKVRAFLDQKVRLLCRFMPAVLLISQRTEGYPFLRRRPKQESHEADTTSITFIRTPSPEAATYIISKLTVPVEGSKFRHTMLYATLPLRIYKPGQKERRGGGLTLC